MASAIENLRSAQQRGMAGRPKVGGFPYLAETLRRAGVARNFWFLPACQSFYLTDKGPVVMMGAPLVSDAEDVPRFNQEALVAALRTDQAGKSTFPEFLAASWKAGVVKYDVDFAARTCTYYGLGDEKYVESYPAVDIEGPSGSRPDNLFEPHLKFNFGMKGDGMKRMLRLGMCAVFLSGCIAHHTIKPLQLDRNPSSAKNPGTITYFVAGSSLFGGAEELRTILREEAPFASVERVTERPMKGRHVDIRVEIIPPNMAAFAWGYVAVAAFLTLLPAWSAKDGSRIYYEVYSDGERVKTFEYEIRRKGLVWIVALPFIWANLFTRSEKEAFALSARQFFAEAGPLLAE